MTDVYITTEQFACDEKGIKVPVPESEDINKAVEGLIARAEKAESERDNLKKQLEMFKETYAPTIKEREEHADWVIAKRVELSNRAKKAEHMASLWKQCAKKKNDYYNTSNADLHSLFDDFDEMGYRAGRAEYMASLWKRCAKAFKFDAIETEAFYQCHYDRANEAEDELEILKKKHEETIGTLNAMAEMTNAIISDCAMWRTSYEHLEKEYLVLEKDALILAVYIEDKDAGEPVWSTAQWEALERILALKEQQLAENLSCQDCRYYPPDPQSDCCDNCKAFSDFEAK
jgi:hypothetical protein